MNKADEIISAALDGERVDVGALRRALATGEARDTLVAFVLLRAATADDDVLPSPLPALTPRHLIAPRASWLAGFRVPAAVAASIAVAAFALSFWMGAIWQAGRPGGGSRMAETAAASTPIRPARGGGESRSDGRPTTSGPAHPTFAEGRGGEPVSIPPCMPGTGAANGPTMRRAGAPARIEPPKPTQFLRFVPGVDWLAASGPEL